MFDKTGSSFVRDSIYIGTVSNFELHKLCKQGRTVSATTSLEMEA
jgi:hypothetical protein